MSPFEALIRGVVQDAGVEPDPSPSDTMYLPGFYRETKSWDVVLPYKGHALAIVEARSQGSSLVNNFNNRVEEATGQAAVSGPNIASWLVRLRFLSDGISAF